MKADIINEMKKSHIITNGYLNQKSKTLVFGKLRNTSLGTPMYQGDTLTSHKTKL